MTTPAIFNAEARRQLRTLPRLQRETLKTLVSELRDAQREVALLLSTALNEGARTSLLRLQSEISRVLETFEARITPQVVRAAGAAWNAGIALVEAPLALMNLQLGSLTLNPRVLEAMGQFLTDRIDDITRKAKDRINSALAQALIGTADTADTLKAVNEVLGGGSLSRARTIVYTELGRAHAIASQHALDARAAVLPGLRKRWVQSTKLHKRPEHVAAHNQMRLASEHFDIGGEKLLHPRDPKASATQTINCGCGMVPVVDGSTLGAARLRFDTGDASSLPTLEPQVDLTPAQQAVMEKRRKQNNEA